MKMNVNKDFIFVLFLLEMVPQVGGVTGMILETVQNRYVWNIIINLVLKSNTSKWFYFLKAI